MPSSRKGSGLENCIPLYFIHFYQATDPIRQNFFHTDPFSLISMEIRPGNFNFNL